MSVAPASVCQPVETGCLRWLTVAILCVSFVVGVLGNGLVLWMTSCRMSRTVTTLWFFNLALADFAVSLFLPISIHTVATGEWKLPQWACKLYQTFQALIFFTSIYLLVLISVDRCVSVLWPIWARNHRTVQRASGLAVAVWLVAAAVCSPYLKLRATKRLDGCVYCYLDFDVENAGQGDTQGWRRHLALTVTHFLLGFLAPLVVIGISAHLIRTRLRREGRVHATRPKRLLVLLVNAFFVCWVPFHVGLWVQLGRYKVRKEALDPKMLVFLWAASSLGCLNSCLNPFLYVFIGRNFQEKFFQSLPSVLARAFGEEGFLSPPVPKVKAPEKEGNLQAEARGAPA
ncbi:putative G-protein coupled receptor 32 [Tamandua tetradactyla]|uniref:putative G-protein coupled receptor 32 n=1 Tax=Tamandua tetradactyla TaxID=48850 RepID=UPI0040545FA4